jgi:hypothetical protein
MNLWEASMHFDARLVRAFLERLSATVEGFGSRQIDRLVRTVETLGVNQHCEHRFEVNYRGRQLPMNVFISKDYFDAPDLHFFAPATLVAEIQCLMDDFGEERSMRHSGQPARSTKRIKRSDPA